MFRTIPRSRATRVLGSVTTALLGAATLAALPGSPSEAASRTSLTTPAIRHVFVINLENKGYDETWGPASAAP